MTPRSLAVQLALSKTRAALNAIQREWNTESEDGEVGVALCTELQQVQTYLRAIAASGQMIDPVVVIKPYLSLLRAATLSGPYKLLALDTLQQFLRHDVLTEYHSAARVTQALDELVSSIIKCKYVQTDAAIDEQAQVSATNALHKV